MVRFYGLGVAWIAVCVCVEGGGGERAEGGGARGNLPVYSGKVSPISKGSHSYIMTL